ncbi:Z1 domain-containing protein [uncultured Corynebacterium sp.]|uniref:Z1 domain-containing protein n=1 Tax=uncultured Corynebacterium sp. TaxID=159447 RepID=UPI0025E071FA|nr:Z1 domain-containing protein [uncultured Corynebacterium sp.]
MNIEDQKRESDIEYFVEEFRRQSNSGYSIPAIADLIRRNPYAAPPEDILEEAQSRYLMSVGRVARYAPMDTLLTNERDHGTWYAGVDEEHHVYWPHVREILRPKLGDALEEVDAASGTVLASLRPPGEDEFDVRGLVLGYVQSGKTTNFISLIAKAADVGYRLIIVLAGMTDNLRKQTQERLDEQLIDDQNWHRLTDQDNDFDAARAKANLQNAQTILSSKEMRSIAIVKKNGHILRSLNEYLQSGGKVTNETPILIIDDESDQASINVSPSAKEEASKINAQIRQLLRNRKTAYVAYTATPFANILVDPNVSDDIYPKDFIHVLPKPKGYFGTEDVFGRSLLHGEDDEVHDGLNMIRTIPEEEVSATQAPTRKDALSEWEPYVSDSLDTAIKWFFLATAARRARDGKSKHSSMLVHTAVRTVAHEMLRDILDEHVRILKTHFKSGKNQEDFRQLWDAEIQEVQLVTDSAGTTSHQPFEEVAPYLPQVMDEVKVIMDNGVSDERLSYSDDDPQTVIAVGGNTLARGLTLEGLVSSYFIRNATAYDTLLQMGRWFGFRKGYEDLPRIWMTEELEGWFRDLALVEADLRSDLSRYAREGITPLDFQARIRTHPSMLVTARAKQQASRPANISYSGQKVQTILFRHKNSTWLQNNIDAARGLASDLKQAGLQEDQRPNGTSVFREADPSVIEDFLDRYTIYEESDLGKNNAELLRKYISGEHESGSIRRWDISFYGKKPSFSSSSHSIELGLEQPLNLVTRSQMTLNSKPEVANIKTLVGPLDRLNSLEIDSQQRNDAVKKIRKDNDSAAEYAYLQVQEDYRGSDIAHLVLYAIDPESKTSQPEDYVHKSGAKAGQLISPSYRRKDLDAVDVPIGLGIFFPTSSGPEAEVNYVQAPEYRDDETYQRIQEAEEELDAMPEQEAE